MINLIPGDPATVILGPEASEQAKEQMREQLGLNKPIVVQYVDWLAACCTETSGNRWSTGRRYRS